MNKKNRSVDIKRFRSEFFWFAGITVLAFLLIVVQVIRSGLYHEPMFYLEVLITTGWWGFIIISVLAAKRFLALDEAKLLTPVIVLIEFALGFVPAMYFGVRLNNTLLFVLIYFAFPILFGSIAFLINIFKKQ